VLTAETLRTDLLDLWGEGRMPISAILLVTHNIEEAVLMSDRILVFGVQPRARRGRDSGRPAAAAQPPRPAFRQLVDDIYALMTARPAGKAPGAFASAAASRHAVAAPFTQPAGGLP
jgi:NitT/TauT family transport system ATP-binding protein